MYVVDIIYKYENFLIIFIASLFRDILVKKKEILVSSKSNLSVQ